MLKDLFRWPRGSVVTLMPNSGIQFLDFGMTAAFASGIRMSFHAETVPGEKDPDGRPREVLHRVEYDEEKQPLIRDPRTGRMLAVDEETVFTVRGEQALAQLAGQWYPAPVLRLRDTGEFADGPFNWARLHITRLAEPDRDGNAWRITLALDTLLADRPGDGRYVMPEPRDAEGITLFGLATGMEDVNQFLRLDWVRGWLHEGFLAAESARRNGAPVTMDDLPNPTLCLAQHITVLAALGAGSEPGQRADQPQGPVVPRLRFLNERPYHRDLKPIPVNLVIDIGNSRTCGILIEEGQDSGQRLDISQAYRLELRDLSNPAHVYADPFESRVEFHPTHFNLGAYSRMSGRPMRDAFWWPTPVRVGPEAVWLSSLTDGTHGRSGLSSPKRYLWDRQERPAPWVNNPARVPVGERPPPIKGPIPSRLTQRGTLVRNNDVPGMKPSYSRSTLYMLMLTELLAHALSQINAPATRANLPRSDEPRELSRIILTIPSATPVAEQRILKRLVRSGVDLLWQVMGWDRNEPLHRRPTVKQDWDEATATHLVYLFNEITQKLQTAPRDFFRLMSRGGGDPARPTLRVASMDMGGGTTDLMIIQHEVTDNDRTILPRQLFREGFRLAGEDVLKQIIEDEILPCLARELTAAGMGQPAHFLAGRFSGDREGMAQQERTLRALFVGQVLRPAALALLAAYEAQGGAKADEALAIPLMGVAGGGCRAAVRDYLELPARRGGAGGFSLDQVVIRTRRDHLEGTIAGVVRPMLTDLCDVVRAFDCDVLLLSGRPSRLPVIRDIVIGQVPVPPGRVIGMDSFDVGNWYPFHSPGFRIEDPKTTAAVGAMLCQVCEGQVEGLLVRASEIRIRSTANHIGVLERNDMLPNHRLAFRDIDLDGGGRKLSDPFSLTPPSFIGYRQLPLERWKTTPLAFLDLKNPQQATGLRMPLQVRLRVQDENGADDVTDSEEFVIEEARDGNGQVVTDQLRLTLQTLRVERDQEAGYWLDSGVLALHWRD
ncbi:virulence factor SrfB [Niveispirillum fermenti]|uniref:virulence factor SrfB n=1 Tax=Niveispirillum fermenti TaxID=1233113 RepID=UPI003A8A2FD4